MTLSTYLSSGTPADGTAATAANTGTISGGFVLGSGSTATWRTAQGNRGERGLMFSASGSASSAVRWAMASTNAQAAFTGVLYTPPVAPTGTATLLAMRQTNGIAGRLQWNSAGELFVTDNGSIARAVVPAGTLSLGNQYAVQLIVSGASTTAGTVSLRVLSLAGTQLAEVTGSNANFTANLLAQFDVFPAGSTESHGWSDVQMDDGRTTYIAPIPANPSYSATLDLSGTGTQTRDGSPSVRAEVISSGTGDLTPRSSVGGRSTLDLSGSGSLSYTAQPSLRDRLELDALTTLNAKGSPSLASLVGLSGTATLTVQGRLMKALTARHQSVSPRSSNADIYYSSQTRTEVRVP